MPRKRQEKKRQEKKRQEKKRQGYKKPDVYQREDPVTVEPDGLAGVDPRPPAAVEPLDVAVAVAVEHPPDAGDGETLGVVIGDHGGVGAQSSATTLGSSRCAATHAAPVRYSGCA